MSEWFGGGTDKDFRNEIESLIRLKTDRLIADGMKPAAAGRIEMDIHSTYFRHVLSQLQV